MAHRTSNVSRLSPLLLCFLFACVVIPSHAAGVPWEQIHARYVQGNEHYRQGEYSEAIEAYRFVLSQLPNGYVYHNLGNAYLRQGERGWAIWCYEKALELLPRDDQTHLNLEHANLQNEDRFEYEASPISLAQVYNRLTQAELATVYSSIFAALVITLLVGLYQKRARRWFRFVVATLGGLLVLCVVCMGLKWRSDQIDYAIVIDKQVDVHNGPGNQFDTVFVLHEGAKLESISANQDWLEIGTPDGRRGWVQHGAVVEL